MIKRIREIEQYLDRENPRVIGVAAAEDQDIMELVKEMENAALPGLYWQETAAKSQSFWRKTAFQRTQQK